MTNPEALNALAERLERSAVSDAEHAANNMLYAERADRKFRRRRRTQGPLTIGKDTLMPQEQREYFINQIVEDGKLLLDLKAWLIECHDWLLTNDLDMTCPMQTDPLDLVARIDRSMTGAKA